ncbi:hypothetical protein [Methanocella sp. MCL-LM]|uniref:hypothetical protein n=1 Tax=Methanocella sp. MCL-LM TaxID=3412035 RepID=UPI003C7268AE
MVGYVIELPLRWNYLALKPHLPIHTKLGYGLMLNAITDMWLLTVGLNRKDLNPASITVVKNYIGFLNTMDDYLDDIDDRPTTLRFKKGDELWERRKELFESVRQFDPQVQKKLKRTISASTFTMLGAMAKFKKSGASDLAGALFIREATAGEICRATAELFNVIHEVPVDKAKAVEAAFWNVGMVLQVHDDVGDILKDEREGFSENLVLQILNRRPVEKARLMQALARRKGCGYGTLVRLAPETAREARVLQERYLAAIPESGGFERIRCLLNLSVSFGGQSVALRSIIDRLDL